jgi:hypothetical protein
MKLKAPQIEIPIEDPFRSDLLSRRVTAEQLTEILKSSDEPLVLCINAGWGNGKTTFLRMWRVLLNQEGFKTLYFNAWENDHSDDALISLIGELSAGIAELKLDGQKAVKVQRYLKQAKKLGAVLVKKGLPAAIRVGTGGIIDVTGIDLAEASSRISELAEEVIKEQIDKYEATKQTLTGFRDQLEKFANEATSPEQGEDRRAIVIMIDELDRCRPPYAVEALEKIKHLFNVPNIAFILAVDKEQLGYSIQSMYGQGMNTSGYLRRFIDLDFNLPASELKAFCHAQFQRFGLEEFFEKRVPELRHDRKNVTDAFISFFSGFNLSLREQEHCFASLSLAVRTTEENRTIYPFLLALLIILKIKQPGLYADFVAQRVAHEEILKTINSTSSGREFMQDNYGLALEIQLAACQSRDRDLDDLAKIYGAKANDKSIGEPERKRAANIVEIIQKYSWQSFRGVEGCLNYLVQKIDLVSHFQT